MALHDWIKNTYNVATLATVATPETITTETVANVATVAIANSKTLESLPQITREDLLRIHPAVIEECNLLDILTHALPDDYEDLTNPLILASFARSLRDAGDIKRVGV